MSVAVIALKPLRYAGRLVVRGEVFDTQTDADAKILTAIGSVLSPVAAEALPPDPDPVPVVRRKRRS